MGEDRLTEIRATVLQHDRELAEWFCAYLERSAVDVTANNRIELLDVVAYKGARDALKTVEQLFRDACGLLPESL